MVIGWEECVRCYPFFGQVEKLSDGKRGVVHRVGISMESEIPLLRSDLQVGDVILYAVLEGKIARWVSREKVLWNDCVPDTPEEYRELRERYFKALSWRNFSDILKYWMQDSRYEMHEDPRLFTDICAYQLRKALQDGGYEAFIGLAEAIQNAKHIRNSYSILRDAIKKMIRQCSLKEIERLRGLKDCDFVSPRVKKAFQWVDDHESNGIDAVLEIFSKEQLLDFVLNWNVPWSQVKAFLERARLTRSPILLHRLEEIALKKKILAPAVQRLLREGVEAGWISKQLIAARIRLFRPEFDDIKNILPQRVAFDVLLEEKILDPLWTRLDLLDEYHTSKLLEESSLVLDLETDGCSIWELGWCVGKEEQEADEKGMEKAFEQLLQKMTSAKLVVGHNILDWDAKVLVKHGCEIPEGMPVWDTLLVSFLLEPWKVTHALGGSHRALDDAKKCRSLFLEQARKIGVKTVAKLIWSCHQSHWSLADFYRSLCKAVPPWNLSCRSLEAEQGRIAVPDAWIAEFQWCPGVAAGRGKGFLEYGLEDELFERNDPSSIVLGEFLRRSKKVGIVLHESMIPLWLREREGVRDFIEASRSYESRDAAKLRVLPFSELRENEALLDELDEIHTARKEESPFPIVLGPFWEEDKPEDSTDVFAISDPFSDRIGKRKAWRVWQRRKLDVSVKPLRDSEAIAYRIVQWDIACIRPNSDDVQGYWEDTIERFLKVADRSKGVPILFVDAEGRYNNGGEHRIDLLSLLEDALVSIGRGVKANEYQSRLRRLQIALREGKVLVAPISQMHEWLRLAADANVPIAAVIESVPMEEWELLDGAQKDEESEQTQISKDDGEIGSREEQDDNNTDAEDVDLEPVPLGHRKKSGHARIDDLRAGQLAEKYLDAWIKEIIGPTCSNVDVTVIDPRVQVSLSKGLLLREQLGLPDAKVSVRIREALQCLKTIECEEPEENMEKLRRFVAESFFPGTDGESFNDFFDYQKKPIERILERPSRLNLLVRLPTGGGKSLIFQAPALYRGLHTRRLTLVISPLKALMQDQVEDLWARGFEGTVEYLSSDRPWWEQQQVLQGVRERSVLMLYVAPERLRSRRFMNVLMRRMERDGGLEFLVFDEAHCISQWGHEFRPDYLYAARKVAELRKKYEFPVLLFSATVPEISRREICRALELKDAELELIPENQPLPIKSEIHIRAERVEGTVLESREESWGLEPRVERIADKIRKLEKGSAAIVFVRRRLHAEVVANRLRNLFGEDRIDYFHAGLHVSERDEVYRRYKDMDQPLDVLVATKAFGMGMDIPHIHRCVHLSPPENLDDYLQEVGRIGRKEELWRGKKRLESYIFYSEEDFEYMNDLAKRSRMRFEDLNEFWNAIKSEAKESKSKAKESNGEKFLTLPTQGIPTLPGFFQKGDDSSRSMKVRLALHWLEQCKRADILFILPSLLEIRVDPDKMKHIAEDQEEKQGMRKVAEEISKLPDQGKGFIERLLDAAGSFLGFIFGDSEEKPASQQRESISEAAALASDRQKSKQKDAMIDLRELAQRTGMSEDKVLGVVRAIARKHSDALTITSKVYCAAGRLIRERKIDAQGSEELIRWLQKHWEEGLRQLRGLNGKELRWDIINLNWNFQWLETRELNKKEIDAIQTRQQAALLKLMRLAGGRVEHVLDQEQRNIRKVRFSSSYERHKRQCASIAELAGKIWQRIGKTVAKFNNGAEIISIHLSTFLDLRDNKGHPYRIFQITQAMDLLACLGLVRFQSQLLPMVYLIRLCQTKAPLPEELRTSLEKMDELFRLRRHAMHAFCVVKSKEKFIEGYFQQKTTEGFRMFLMNFLDQEGSREDIGRDEVEKIIKLRDLIDPEQVRKQFDDFFSKHRASKEQWEAISKRVDQHILVNAGPGSGKTAVLIARIVHLIHEQNVHPWEIMVLAFNRAVVHEIRQRVKEVFEKVGYGPYVRQLRVSTFHALAARHLEERASEPEKLLEQFAELLEVEPGKAKEIAGNIRTILVDEFQDMNDERWTILTKLQEANGASIFAIGDDDQDIVAWDRGNEGCERYFEDFKKRFNPKVLHLTTNFRSTEEIVSRSQQMISKLVPNREKKGIKLKSFHKDAGEVVREINCREGYVRRLLEQELQAAKSAAESIAILCRTNAEVAEWHEKLNKKFSKVKVQGGTNYSLAQLRHVAVWLDILGLDAHRQRRLDDRNFRRDVFRRWLNTNIPESRKAKETQGQSEFYQQLRKLWDWCLEDNPRARAIDLIEFVNELKTDDYARMDDQQNAKEHGFRAVISTIHKVKGLEFDRVVVLSSQAPFPFPDPNERFLEKEAIAEAKTYYVAMTRAKNRLVYFIGDRERKWPKREKYDGSRSGRWILDGNPREVFISWPGWYDEIQKTIFQELPIGAFLAGKVRYNGYNGEYLIVDLMFNGKKIGQLSREWIKKNNLAGQLECDLRVAAVLRYPAAEERYENKDKWIWENLTGRVKKQGWLWTLCVHGSIYKG